MHGGHRAAQYTHECPVKLFSLEVTKRAHNISWLGVIKIKTDYEELQKDPMVLNSLRIKQQMTVNVIKCRGADLILLHITLRAQWWALKNYH